LTGEIVKANPPSTHPPRYHPQRARRTRLQSALISKVPDGVIRLNKKLVELEDLSDDGVRLVFEDGEEVIADLVVGGDGIRSVSKIILLLWNHLTINRWSDNMYFQTTQSSSQERPYSES
jgi:hypothetical protein